MRWSRKPAALAAALVLAGTAAGAAAPPPSSGAVPCAVTKTANVAVSMRDGIVLRADVYRPASSRSVPVILMRTQYGKEAAQVQPSRCQRPDWFASH